MSITLRQGMNFWLKYGLQIKVKQQNQQKSQLLNQPDFNIQQAQPYHILKVKTNVKVYLLIRR